MNDNGDIPETFFDDRITLGIELSVFDINENNYELGAKTVLCLLLKHFTQRDFDPDKLKLDDLLLHNGNYADRIELLERKLLTTLHQKMYNKIHPRGSNQYLCQ